MGECAKRNCSYYWQDENDDYPRCHFESWGPAPCEEDDWHDEEEEWEGDDWHDDGGYDECGFDPYLGCYTNDC